MVQRMSENLPHHTENAATSSVVLECRDLCVERGGRRVLEGISLALVEGQALIVRGANGAGKSTLLRTLAGFITPVSGTLTWRDENALDNRAALQDQVHYLGHQDPIKLVLSVHDNLSIWTGILGDDCNIDGALEWFGLAHLANTPARYLSAGQRRRLALARMVAIQRPLWLLDEPSVSLDRLAAGQLEILIDNHRKTGGIVVVATHGEIDIDRAHTITLEAQA